MAGTGAQMITMAAPATASSREGAPRTGPRSARERQRAGSGSHPTTSQPTREEAIAIEVPIRPVPTTAMRSGSVEVIA